MNNSKKYAALMEKADNNWHKSFKKDGSRNLFKKHRAKRLYRQAEIIRLESGATKIDNRKTNINGTINNNKFGLFNSIFQFGKDKKSK